VFSLVLVAIACSPTTAVYCTPDETMCHGSCSAFYKDPQNCGGCDIACAPGLVCSDGACATSCGGGTVQCGQSCVQTFVDRDNCGSCGHVCTAGEVCSKGSCGTTCAAGQTFCIATAPYCANVTSDNANCGKCGLHCGPKEYCVQGKCTTTCASDQTLCTDTCVNLQSDAAHCGSCNGFCVQNQHCIDGACVCAQGLTMCSGACVDTSTDENYCGGCNQKCVGTCEGGRCAAVLAYTSSAADALAQDSTNVYWTETSGEVHQRAKAIATYQVLATGAYASALGVDASNVYWPNGAAIEIAQIGGNGSSEQTLPYVAIEVTAGGGYVFAADSTGIRRFPSGGGTVSTVVTDTKPHALAIANGMIVWANDAYQIQRANLDGTSQATLTTMTSPIGRLATDGYSVFFTWGSDVLSVPIQTPGSPLVLATGLLGISDVATDGNEVFWNDASGISKVSVNGGPKSLIHASNGDIVRIAVDTTAVYWTSSSAQIGKLSPK